MSDRNSIRHDAEDEALRSARHERSWTCRRCLHDFDTDNPDWVDGDGNVLECPPCPACGQDALVVTDSEYEQDICIGCGKEYDAPLDSWCHGEYFVCPDCIKNWESDGGGYRCCTGCGDLMLFSSPPPLGHVSSGKPCGQWQEVAS